MSRRGASEGSVYQRADGRWAAAAPAGYGARVRPQEPGVEHPTSNTRKRTTVYGATRREVERKLQALRRDADQGLPRADQRTTTAAYLQHWLETVAPRLRPATLQRYRGLVERQLIPHLGRVPLAKLTPADVAGMLAQLQADGLSPRTCSHSRAVLRAAIADAERVGVVARNVVRLTHAPRVPSPSPTMLNPAETQAVIEAMPDPEIQRLATVAVNSGLRQGELLGLRWQDVDFQAGELHVVRALQRLGGQFRLVETKSRTSRRTVPVTAAARDALTEERQAQREARLAAGSRWREEIPGLVFTTATGAPRTGSTITHHFTAALAAAGIAHMRWHDLRAAFGGLMLASGADLATVSSLLGHSSISITASTYAGVLPSLKSEAARRFEQLMSRSI